MMTIHMIYPEVQCVTEEDIATMYSDGVANGECNPGFEDDLEGMMEELQSSGKFTFEAFDHQGVPNFDVNPYAEGTQVLLTTDFLML